MCKHSMCKYMRIHTKLSIAGNTCTTVDGIPSLLVRGEILSRPATENADSRLKTAARRQ